MNAKQLAAKLHDREYGNEITDAEAKNAKANGLLVIFGYSDDNIELRGTIDDEAGAFGGTTLYLTRSAVLIDAEAEECKRCYKRFMEIRKQAVAVNCEWDTEGYSWFITPGCNYATFDILEGGEKFCRGVVIEAKDLPDLKWE